MTFKIIAAHLMGFEKGTMDDTVQPYTWIAIKLPSDAHRVIQVTPDTYVT